MTKAAQSLLFNSLGLPRFSTIEQFSEITGLSTRLLFCLSNLTENYYKNKKVPKRDGNMRDIYVPSYTLRIVQKWILKNILNKIVPSDQSMAFRTGSSFGNKQNAAYHAYTLYGLSIDLKDFFPSIPANKVYNIFSSLGYNEFAATILTKLCTLDSKLPQGSPCSPAISNLVCITLDNRLSGLCQKRGIIYTRYADDMYFSCDDKTLLLRYYHAFKHIIEDEGFKINERKTHFNTPSNRKRITGVTVIQHHVDEKFELKAPKEMKRKVRAEIFKCLMSGNYEIKDRILGEINYIAFIEKENNFNYISSIKQYVAKTAEKIIYFPELVEAYNNNLFFCELKKIESIPVDPKDEEDLYFFSDMYCSRKIFLNKHNLTDACLYEKWPRAITSQSLCFKDNDDLPF